MIRSALTFAAGVVAGGYIAAVVTLARTAHACPLIVEACIDRVLP